MYTVFDLETTGLNKQWNEIIEICAVKLDKDFNKVGEYHTLVKPKNAIPEFITEINNISNEMVKDSPNIFTVIPKLLEFVGDDIVVAHNATFDIGFVNNKADFISRYVPRKNENLGRYLCTMEMFKTLNPDLSGKLVNATKHYGIELTDAHRAFGDVEATINLLKKLSEFTEFDKFVKVFGVDEPYKHKKMKKKDDKAIEKDVVELLKEKTMLKDIIENQKSTLGVVVPIALDWLGGHNQFIIDYEKELESIVDGSSSIKASKKIKESIEAFLSGNLERSN